MSVETLVWLVVVYAIGVYITAFVMGVIYENKGMKFEEGDWFACLCWPICILGLAVSSVVCGASLLSERTLFSLESRFPVIMRFLQRTWKCIRTAIFVISLLFRPVKFGEVVGKRIFRDRV